MSQGDLSLTKSLLECARLGTNLDLGFEDLFYHLLNEKLYCKLSYARSDGYFFFTREKNISSNGNREQCFST